MTMRKILQLTFIATAAMALSACGGEVKEALGMGKRAPDEFQVVTRAPLSLPPDYSLKPPAPGERRPQEQPIRDQARSAIISQPETAAASGTWQPSSIEQSVLQNANAENPNPSIRDTVNRENRQIIEANDTLVKDILFWKKQTHGTVVEPIGEAERIKQNKQEGKPVTEGETPQIDSNKKGLLEF